MAAYGNRDWRQHEQNQRSEPGTHTENMSEMTTDLLRQRFTHHAIQRMHEREINVDHVKETVRQGVRRPCGRAVLYVSDHMTVVTNGARFITAWRNDLMCLWPCVQSNNHEMTADTAFSFFQHKDKVMFAGVLDLGGQQAEVGFGLHRLRSAHEDTHYDVMTIGLTRQAPATIRSERLRLERIMRREDRGNEVVTFDRPPTDREINDVLHEVESVMSEATTQHGQQHPGYPISLSIRGTMHQDLTVRRKLYADSEGGMQSDARSWVKFSVGDELAVPYAGFGRLVEIMQETQTCLPEVAGRWTYLDPRYNNSNYRYTILPLKKSQQGSKISFHVVCVQSDDRDDEEYSIYRRIGVGRGELSLDSTGQPSSLVLRIVMGKVGEERMKRDGTMLELWRGDTHSLRGTTETELRRETSPPQTQIESLNVQDVDLQGFERLMEEFLPLQLTWEEALQCGEIERVELLVQHDKNLLTGYVRVHKMINSPRLHSDDGFLVLPIVAAALYRQFDVVDALLSRHRAIDMELDVFVLTVLSGSERARRMLEERLRQNPRLLNERCPRHLQQRRHPLASPYPRADPRFVDCRLIEIAARLQLGDTVTLLRGMGSTHTAVSALQAGNVDVVRGFLRKTAGTNLVNSHFEGNSAAEANIATMTPLVYAVYRNDVAMARMLLEEGADIFVRRRGQESTSINYAQIYDRNVREGFPVLQLLLEEYKRRRRDGRCPPDWINLRERCEKWLDSTHPEALKLIVEYEIDMEDGDSGDVGEDLDETTSGVMNISLGGGEEHEG
eukprot:768425-Hanusia_phi.AAC.1